MTQAVPQFEPLCRELTAHERALVDTYLGHYGCPEDAPFYRNYFFRLYWLAARSGARTVVELGASPGGSSIALTWAVERTDGHLWSCDVGVLPQDQMEALGMSGSRRTIVTARAADFGRAWTSGAVDLVYLDTAHTYDDTVEEIAAWLPHLREGGLFVFHDTAACCKTVMPAIGRFLADPSRIFEFHHFPDCHGHGVLQWFAHDSVARLAASAGVSVTHLLLAEGYDAVR